MDKKGNALGVPIQTHEDHHRPNRISDSVAKGYPACMRAISAIAMLCKQTEEIIIGSLLTIYVPHSVKSAMKSHHIQHYSVS